MDPGDGRKVGAWREIARQYLIGLAFQGALDRTQSVGPLGMALAHLVRQAGWVTDDERGHDLDVLLGDCVSPLTEAELLRQCRRKSIRYDGRTGV